MDLIKVEYVGKKPHAIDNVAHSGKAWAGPGDVQEVTPQQAKTLTAHTDQWALVDPADADKLLAQHLVKVQTGGGSTEDTFDADELLKKSVEKMTAPELIAYAQIRHKKTLKRAARKVLLDQVMALDKGASFV